MISVAGTLVADLMVRPIRGRPGKSQNASVFCPSLLEASAITGKSNAAEAATVLVAASVRKFVAVTEGSRGALIDVVGEGQEFIPARPVKAIDTTGAGDAFIAGVLAAWYRGYPWWTAAQIGALVASIAITGSTRYESLRNLEEHLAEPTRDTNHPSTHSSFSEVGPVRDECSHR